MGQQVPAGSAGERGGEGRGGNDRQVNKLRCNCPPFLKKHFVHAIIMLILLFVLQPAQWDQSAEIKAAPLVRELCLVVSLSRATVAAAGVV